MSAEEEELTPEQIVERARRNQVSMYHRVFNTEDGKKVLEDLVRFSGYEYPSYNYGQGEAGMIDAIFTDGGKRIVGYIKELLKVEQDDQLEEPAQTEITE